MLKQRITTGIVLAVIFLTALFAFNELVFTVFLFFVAALCAWEWARLSGLEAVASRVIYSVGILVLMLILQLAVTDQASFRYIVLFSMLWWIGVCLTLYMAPLGKLSSKGLSTYTLISGPLTIAPAMLSAQYLRDGEGGSAWMLLFALALVWAMDIGAYFTGKRFGKNKLAPQISPGKTIEGVLGGVAASLVLWLMVMLLRSTSEPSAMILLFAVVTAGPLSVVGDLYESRAKRMAGMKDSGTILPGHGGILDRLDSAFAALPLFSFALVWL